MRYIPSWHDLWESVASWLHDQISLLPGMFLGFGLIAWAIRDVFRADQADPKPNVQQSGLRIAQIHLGATYQWTHATYPDDSTYRGILALFSNVPLDRPIGDAFPVRARITYLNPQGEAAAMNPAPWLDEQDDSTSLKAGETRELILGISPIDSRYVKGLEDRRKAGGIYVQTPAFSSANVIVTLTVNGLLQGPYRFRLDATQNPLTIARLKDPKRSWFSWYSQHQTKKP